MDNIIEKLKDKDYVRAFGLMKPEEQEVLESVGWQNRLVYILNKWRTDSGKIKGNEREDLTYAIKPDYQPEPEDKCPYCGAPRIVRTSGKWQYYCQCDDPNKRPKKPEPEPEYVNLEIEEFADGENTKWLGVWNTPEAFFLPHQFTHLHCLPSLRFECFWYKFQGGKVEFYTDGKVSKLISEGKKVYARFRK